MNKAPDEREGASLGSIRRRGLMMVLSSPSGAGKTTISRELLRTEPNLTMSVSATTRPPRPGEQEGVDYFFIGKAEFDRMIKEGAFLEQAEVFGNHYGTPRRPVEKALSQGHDVLFDVDWQGTQQLAANARDDLVSVFILPPSMEELERRLQTRAQDSAEVVAQRMAKASDEMSHYREYGYIVVNQDIEESVARIRAILAAERLKQQRLVGLHDFIAGLRKT